MENSPQLGVVMLLEGLPATDTAVVGIYQIAINVPQSLASVLLAATTALGDFVGLVAGMPDRESAVTDYFIE